MSRTLGILIQLLVACILIAVLAGVVVTVVSVRSIANAPGQAANDVGASLTGAVGGARRAIQDVTDPNRPPTDLAYDTEFAALQLWRLGDGLPGGTRYVLTVGAIRRREGAPSVDTGQYAVVHAELRQPNEARFLGQVLRSDSDPHDHVVYKGETFRIGRALYRVNWISQEEGAMAAGLYRRPDAVSARLVFEYD
jgi:hypothetical protein